MYFNFLLCFSFFLFVLFSIFKFISFSRLANNSRMELYPVPKEKKGKSHGGSYYEELNWWMKPHNTSRLHELKELFKEVLFIHKLFVHNRPFWYFSYTMHLGFYLSALFSFFLFINALLITFQCNNNLFTRITIYSGASGIFLVMLGSLSLLCLRLTKITQRRYSTPKEYFNLIFIFITAFSGFLVWLKDPSFIYAQDTVLSILHFAPFQADILTQIHLLLLSGLLVFIPISSMGHYVGKYFSFHDILWDNEPNLPGNRIEKKIISRGGKENDTPQRH